MKTKLLNSMRPEKAMVKFILMQVLALLLFSVSCKQEYKPPAINTNLNLLIVDGALNNSSDSTFIRLSRTKKLSSGLKNSGENNAELWIEDLNGNPLYFFQPFNTDGVYMIPGMNLDGNSKYRLRINTLDGNQYTSDEMPVLATPLIDSVSWKRTNDGVTVYVNTHDPLSKTKYYRWDYTETWQYHSPHFSVIKYLGGALIDRTADEIIYDCWKTQNSTDLLLASSAKLSEDVIFEMPLRFIPMNSFELSDRYSMLLRQYALSKEAFNYLENLKKITEQMGSIFDAQPSQLTGNMHSINNPQQTVLGYMTLSTVQSVRKFIRNAEVTPWQTGFYCERKEITPDSLGFYFGELGYLPIDKNMRGPDLISAGGAAPECVDCRIRGGSTTKPDFW